MRRLKYLRRDAPWPFYRALLKNHSGVRGSLRGSCYSSGLGSPSLESTSDSAASHAVSFIFRGGVASMAVIQEFIDLPAYLGQ